MLEYINVYCFGMIKKVSIRSRIDQWCERCCFGHWLYWSTLTQTVKCLCCSINKTKKTITTLLDQSPQSVSTKLVGLEINNGQPFTSTPHPSQPSPTSSSLSFPPASPPPANVAFTPRTPANLISFRCIQVHFSSFKNNCTIPKHERVTKARCLIIYNT